MQAEVTILCFKNGMNLAWSGLTPVDLCPQECYGRSEKACFAHGVGRKSHMLYKVYKMQEQLEANGIMKITNLN